MTPVSANAVTQYLSSMRAAYGLGAHTAETTFYTPLAKLVVRSRLPEGVLETSVMRVLRQLNPAQPAASFRPLETMVSRSVAPRRFFMLLVSVFAGLGLVLAALGAYGVIAYTVTQQTQEIGIRMALGASRGRVP